MTRAALPDSTCRRARSPSCADSCPHPASTRSPLRGSPKLNSLITAIGFSFLLEYGGQFVFGPNPRAFGALPVDPSDQFRVLGVSISYIDLICVGVSVGLMVLLTIIYAIKVATGIEKPLPPEEPGAAAHH